MTTLFKTGYALPTALLIIPFLTMGCDSTPGVDRSQLIINKPSKIEGSPDVPEYSVWRPFFVTDAGDVSSGTTVGTAFLAQLPDSDNSYLVTASHLLGPTTGLTRDISPNEWGTAIKSASVGDAFGATDAVKQLGRPLTPADAKQNELKWLDLDIIVFDKGKSLKGNPLQFSNETIQVGQRLWMATALFEGASPSQKCHEVKVVDVDSSGSIRYAFENPKVSFRATDGAPLLFDSGAIAGIHLRGQTIESGPVGSGLDSKALQSALQELAGQTTTSAKGAVSARGLATSARFASQL
ncbi:hypothetical protein [Allorhodopirellula solitaria]|uniref:Trypsin n=1 Tax=Allorhodopirellula solitaria TaxID=2527987 RepID=A0A5C5XTA1_9BACT|nr:hypothetical protein [Allorhodopirellula solitaria]TWT66130.1 hypothetical protein CA85_29940 [Allorhodopirellula solitaria]